MLENPFKILGIKVRYYSEAELKEHYMNALKDLTPNYDPQRFKLIKEAYEQIRNSMSIYGTELLVGFKEIGVKEVQDAYTYVESKVKVLKDRKEELILSSVRKKLLNYKHNSCKNK